MVAKVWIGCDWVNLLVVVAHPDDEVLGAGATMYKLSRKGHMVSVCILVGEAEARCNRPSVEELHDDVTDSLAHLGVTQVIKGSFPNIKLNTIPHLELVQFIERAIDATDAEIVLTHHPADLNNDHLHTSLACQAAVRLFQRRPGVRAIKELLFMEVPSATEWALNKSMQAFAPNTFVEVGKEAVGKKIEALAKYRGVMRDYPHPRSPEVLMGLAAYRGGQAGMEYAEAYESVFRRGLI